MEVVDRLCYKTPTLSLDRQFVPKDMDLLEENARAHVTTMGEKTSRAKGSWRDSMVMSESKNHASDDKENFVYCLWQHVQAISSR